MLEDILVRLWRVKKFEILCVKIHSQVCLIITYSYDIGDWTVFLLIDLTCFDLSRKKASLLAFINIESNYLTLSN